MLNEILKCEKCGENIKILDTVDRIEIKCEKCNQPYFIDSKGYGIVIEDDIFPPENKIIYRLKNPNRIPLEL